MSKAKRYSVTLDLYIDARNDREALVKAAQFAEVQRNLYDNQAQILSVDETPFGSLQTRNVHTGRLTIFENKLIEV